MMKEHEERGIAIVELALVAPLLFFLSLGCLELVSALRGLQVATAISRELANVVYRRCSISALDLVNSQEFDLDYCLSSSTNYVQGRLANVASDAQFVVSFYRYDPTKKTVSLDSMFKTTNAESGSRFKLSDFNDKEHLTKAVSGVETIILAEVYLPHTVLSMPIPGWSTEGPPRMYAYTIM
jgi:hypothetical protein